MYENFGFAPPIGSKISKIDIFWKYLEKFTHLNDGTGNPCAGHDKLIAWLNSFNKMDPFDSCANLGLAPPH